MTKKDYVKFADLFAGEAALIKSLEHSDIRKSATVTLSNVVRSSADIFAQDNPRFNRDKFMEASGFTYDLMFGWQLL